MSRFLPDTLKVIERWPYLFSEASEYLSPLVPAAARSFPPSALRRRSVRARPDRR
jgi:hypothetical protein